MPSIEQYRFFVAAQQEMSPGERAHRVKTEDGQLITGSGFPGSRLMQWLKPSESFKERNRTAMEDFRAALVQAYGETIAGQVFDSCLGTRHAQGRNLSGRRIEMALYLADHLREQTTVANQGIVREEWKALDLAFSGEHGRSLKDLLGEKGFRDLEHEALRSVNHDPRLRNEKMDSDTGRAYVKALLQDVIQSFLDNRDRALGQQFGGVMEQLELTGTDVQNARTIAHAIAALTPPEGAGEPERVSFQKAQAQLLQGFDTLCRTAPLLEQTPFEQQDIQFTDTVIQSQLASLKARRNDLLPLVEGQNQELGGLAAALIQDLDNHIALLEAKLEQIHLYDGYQPLSEANIAHAQNMLNLGAVRLLESYREGLSPEQEERLNEAIEKIQQDGRQLLEGARHDVVVAQPGEAMKGHRAGLLNELNGVLKEVLGTRTPSTKQIEKQFKLSHTEAMNRDQRWDVVENTVTFRLGGQTYQYTSTITPGSKIPSLSGSYGDLEGVCSEDTRQSEHTVNLCHTQLHDKDGNEIFSGVRHGIHAATGLPAGSGEREEANIARAKECVTAGLLGNKGALALALQRAREGNEEPVPLTLSSLSLVTPFSGPKGESHLWTDQKRAWDHINANPVRTIEVRDPESGEMVKVKVQVKVLAFSFGVNPGAMGESKIGPLALKHPSVGWGEDIAKNNYAGLVQLMGNVRRGDQIGGLIGEYLKRDDISARDRRIVNELVDQIREMWKDGSYMKPGGDVYKMVSRIAVLCNKIGVTPMWNCKSGKDRTGHLDAEIKHLCAMIETTGSVPRPGKLDSEGEGVFREFALHSGNLEIQRYNTGFRGYKTFNVKSNIERMGESPRARELYMEGGKYVKT